MFIECKQFLLNCTKGFLSNLTFLFQLNLIPERFLSICITSELIILSYYKLKIKHLERLVHFNSFTYTTNEII